MSKKILWVVILSGFALTSVHGLSFKQVAYIPSGITWSEGYIRGMDVNNDGLEDLMFRTYMGGWQGTVFWGYRPYNRYVFEDSAEWAYFWDVGYLDSDSLMDIITQYATAPNDVYIRVYEQPARGFFPRVPVWSWKYEFIGNQVQPMYITDLDLT